MEPKTIVADIANELTRRVLTGKCPPRELMLSVRQVADEFEVNRATAQLVLGRLESHGIVTAYRARGFMVRDIEMEGGVEVFRHTFPLWSQAPDVAFDAFRDVVEVERTIVMEALLDYTMGDHRAGLVGLEDVIDELESIARLDEPDLPAMLEQELAIVRHVLFAVGRPFQRAILNSIGEMVLDVPEAVAAYYAVAPDLHVLVWRGLAAVWNSGTEPSASQLALFEDLFSSYHERVLRYFADVLGIDEGADPASVSA